MYSTNVFACLLILVVLAGCSDKPKPVAIKNATPVVAPAVRLSPDGATATPDVKNTIELDYMRSGSYHASSKSIDPNALGGFGGSDNMPYKITVDGAKQSGECYLLAEPSIATDFGNEKGMRLVLVNGTEESAVFSACDSRLSIVQEAKDESGEWKAIEYVQRSWCGNSYHNVMLPSKHFWKFSPPRYDGSFRTKLRFRLTVGSDQTLLVSNEFQGGINPRQFTEKQQHNPTNLMDPYEPVPPPTPLILDEENELESTLTGE